MLGTDHEWVKTVRTNTAGILTAEVNQVWSLGVSEVLVVYPVSLLVETVVLKVEVVN